MENNKKGWMNIQLFGDSEDAETSQNGESQAPAQQSVNYEEEYKKQAAEIVKLKAAISKNNSDIAEYKKKAQAQMSEEDKKAAAMQEILDAKTALEAKIKEYETRDELLSNGFTKDECDTLMKGGLSIKDFAAIMSKRIEENSKSIKAGLIKETTPSMPMGSGNTNNEPQSYATKLAKENHKDSDKLQAIKDRYK